MDHALPEHGRQRDPGELHVAFQDAFNRHDLDAVVSLYEPTAVLLSGGTVVEGANDIRDFYRRLFELKPQLTLRTLIACRYPAPRVTTATHSAHRARSRRRYPHWRCNEAGFHRRSTSRTRIRSATWTTCRTPVAMQTSERC